MVNHFRTLLLNLPPTPTPGPGEEYVPSTFQPVTLPQPLQDVRSLLITSSTVRSDLNAQVARILAYLHTSPLRAFATYFDNRITYDPTLPADAVTGLLAPPPTSFIDAAYKQVDERVVFRPGKSEAEQLWFYTWSGLYPDALRATALALALVARIEEVRTNTYVP